MAENNNHQPATKGDIAAVKTDLVAVRTELKSDITAVRTELAEVKTELKSDIKNLSGEILKINFRMDRMENTINTKVAMKDDLNRIFNLLDSITGSVKGYQREDTLRGEAVMQHEETLSNHETRITLLETRK